MDEILMITNGITEKEREKLVEIITNELKCSKQNIKEIRELKKGMTNESFLFTLDDCRYILRVPGKGTDKLINRAKEADVYKAIEGKGICDAPVSINSKNGYKITRYLENARACNAKNISDIKKSMKLLRYFHELHITVPHTFDIFERIEFYEKLRNGAPSAYDDYYDTKRKINSLRLFIDSVEKDWCLTHIDAVSDNFLLYTLPDGREKIQLTDWEYSGMQDPHVDIAMFCIYSLYSKKQCDQLINVYFENETGGVQPTTRAKIYAYIAACGLLWSNWCEYKETLGVAFGTYAYCQYCYAKDFYGYAVEMI